MKEKTKSTKQNKFFTLENIGLFLAIIACIIFWLPIHKYTESSGILFWKTTSEKFLDLKPDLISGCIALIFTFILYLRGIISFENKISNESPIGNAIFGKKVGDVISVTSPNGSYNVKIVKIA